MNTPAIKITPRAVDFDFGQSSIHWIPHDPFSSHTYNAINLLLPAGEFWFCRVFNKALPSITDKTLEEDAAKQEHARNQKWKNHFNTAFIIAFWFLWSCFILMVFALIFHWVMPDTWHWLKPEQRWFHMFEQLKAYL